MFLIRFTQISVSSLAQIGGIARPPPVATLIQNTERMQIYVENGHQCSVFCVCLYVYACVGLLSTFT